MPTRFINQDEQETLQGIGPPTGTPPGGITKYIDLSTGDVYVNTNGVWTGPGLGPNASFVKASTASLYVLQFDKTKVANVYHGFFWPYTPSQLGNFFWEAWLAPNVCDGPNYWISDGYGGAHAILAGFQQGDSGRNCVSGNVWINSGNVSFTTTIGFAPDEWGHVAIGWDGINIYVWINGVLSNVIAAAGIRTALDPSAGSSDLMIGGSTHQNFDGKIAIVRGFEGDMPYGNSFTPQRPLPPVDGANQRAADFLASYQNPIGAFVPDLSPAGFNGSRHPGVMCGGRSGFGVGVNVPTVFPTYVVDLGNPFASLTNPPLPVEVIDVAPATPAGALFFDSFSRRNQTYAFQTVPSLGQTEIGGTTWIPDNGVVMGILRGRAFLYAANGGSMFNTGRTAHGVYCDRWNTSGIAAGQDFTVSMRLGGTDHLNYVYVNGWAIYKVVAGVATLLVGGANPANATWRTMRAVTDGISTVSLYNDDGAGGWVLNCTVTDASIPKGSLVGIGTGPSDAATPMRRWDNFTVKAA